MSKFQFKKVIPRYSAIAIAMTLFCLIILGKALYIMTVEKDYWQKVAARQKRDSVSVRPVRGNILSCDGQLMASSIPEFKIYMDFKAGGAKKDSLWMAKLDSICDGLHKIFPSMTAAEFRRHLEEGRMKQSQNWLIWPKRIDYNTYTEVKKLPVFNLSPYKGGFHKEGFDSRQRPFGSLAMRTVGDLYKGQDMAKNGLELSYDSILRGTNGIMHRRKVMNKFLSITDVPPTDGADIVTTIDVNIQDLAERAVIEELKEINGHVGVAIVMEVATGDIKAIVNMSKAADGEYYEQKNNAVSDLLEPGSVFKTASIMVALDDGVVDTTYRVDTGCGIWPMYGREMKDHNWRRGGYGMISLPRSLQVSSNIGVSRIIDEHYHNNPEKFVEGIYRTGLADDLNLPIVGSTPPKIRMPKKNSRGQWLNWSKTALAWMSIGYETQIPPISTLTFYNAIANDGRMMQPRFVKEIMKDGEVIQTFPPKVLREHIAKPKTIKEIQTILEQVVSIGLGSKAGSKSFKVAGKTGTAQISQGAGGYKTGTTRYLLSFAGFFPADKPRYSCIVCIQKSGLPASGGGMSGVVFRHIAEGIMAQSLKLDAKDAKDSTSVFIPDVKGGNTIAADYIISHLNINGVKLKKDAEVAADITPDVTGMGASDAVYALEKRGLRVRVIGRGKVKEQSYPAGKKIVRGAVCTITLK